MVTGREGGERENVGCKGGKEKWGTGRKSRNDEELRVG